MPACHNRVLAQLLATSLPTAWSRSACGNTLCRRLEPFRDFVTDIEVQVLNAAGSVELTYRLADLEVQDIYSLSISKPATGQQGRLHVYIMYQPVWGSKQ